jgi:hypothetical protein
VRLSVTVSDCAWGPGACTGAVSAASGALTSCGCRAVRLDALPMVLSLSRSRPFVGSAPPGTAREGQGYPIRTRRGGSRFPQS